MEITTIQAIIIGLWAAIAITGSLLGNYTATPIVYAAGVGIILGDIETGVIVGAAGQTVWIGFGISQGGVRPPEPIAPGIFATVLAITSRPIVPEGATQAAISITEAGVFIGFSVPIGILMQLVITSLFTGLAPISQWAKTALENGKYRRFTILSHTSFVVLMLLAFIFGLIVGLSANGLATVANGLPDWLRTGFRVAGGMLPALGFALILKVMLKREYLGFVFIGYFLAIVFDAIAKVTQTSFSVLGLAITAVGLVLIILSIAKLAGFDQKLKTSVAPAGVAANVQVGEQDGI